jgi:multidrug efflux pump subunit AcrA (membrane-fusion protein)
VPPLALLDARADQGVVFVVDEGNIARRRAVRTAGISQAGVLVIEGLAPGERVISAGAAYVRDGEPVRLATGA